MRKSGRGGVNGTGSAPAGPGGAAVGDGGQGGIGREDVDALRGILFEAQGTLTPEMEQRYQAFVRTTGPSSSSLASSASPLGSPPQAIAQAAAASAMGAARTAAAAAASAAASAASGRENDDANAPKKTNLPTKGGKSKVDPSRLSSTARRRLDDARKQDASVQNALSPNRRTKGKNNPL